MACLTLAPSPNVIRTTWPSRQLHPVRHVNPPDLRMLRYATSERIMTYGVPRLLQACFVLLPVAARASMGDTLWHLAVVRGPGVALAVPVQAVLPGEDTISHTCA